MPDATSNTLDVVRRAVRGVVERTPTLADRPDLRRRLAKHMVGVSLAAAELIDAERRLDAGIARTRGPGAGASGSDTAGRSGARASGTEPGTAPPLAAAQAAGDIHRRTAVNAAAGVLQGTRQAIDFPGFVTSLITGVFQAMTTSTIQQLEAYANLLASIDTSASAFAASGITPGRAATWAAGRFPQLVITPGDEPTLALGDDADMPEPAALRAALDATDDEVSEIDEDDLEGTLLPLVARKLARDRQSMLATMVLMGMNRIVVDDGRIHASMELQVDARSTAEQLQSERFDTRVSTAASGSFGMGMWGASASLQATVGYIRSDEQFTREDIALRAGLRSSVDIGFHTEPLDLNRMASPNRVGRIRDRSMVPEAERNRESLLTPDERRTTRPTLDAIPSLPEAPDPGSQEQRDLRARQDFGPPADGDSGGASGGGDAVTGGSAGGDAGGGGAGSGDAGSDGAGAGSGGTGGAPGSEGPPGDPGGSPGTGPAPPSGDTGAEGDAAPPPEGP